MNKDLNKNNKNLDGFGYDEEFISEPIYRRKVDNRQNYLYKESDRFEKKRRELLVLVVEYIETEKLRKGFMQKLFEFIDSLILNMIKSEDEFYATFLLKVRKSIDFTLEWPLASFILDDEIEFKINPISFLYLDENEMKGILKHEILHLILHHHNREKTLKSEYSKIAINIAMDISVNQYINHLPGFSLKLNSVNLALDLNMKLNETLEYYTKEISKAINRDNMLIGKIRDLTGLDYSLVHDEWSRGNDLNKEISREKLNSTIIYASKGSVPEEIKSLLPNLNKAKINWVNEIRNAIKLIPSKNKKTITRRNRRQPERLDLRGDIKKYTPKIVIALDISASIENEDVKDFLSEMLSLVNYYKEPIRVIECDDTIRRDYTIKTFNDIKDITERTGATRFSPVFKLLREENNRESLLIYFTDGFGEEKLNVRPINDTIWVVTGSKLSLENPNGKVLFLNREKQEIDRTIGLQSMRELLNEWAR